MDSEWMNDPRKGGVIDWINRAERAERALRAVQFELSKQRDQWNTHLARDIQAAIAEHTDNE